MDDPAGVIAEEADGPEDDKDDCDDVKNASHFLLINGDECVVAGWAPTYIMNKYDMFK